MNATLEPLEARDDAGEAGQRVGLLDLELDMSFLALFFRLEIEAAEEATDDAEEERPRAVEAVAGGWPSCFLALRRSRAAGLTGMNFL